MAKTYFGIQTTEPGTGGGLGWEEEPPGEGGEGDDGDDGGGNAEDEFADIDKAGLIKALQAQREKTKTAKAAADKLAAEQAEARKAAEAAEDERARKAGEFVDLFEKSEAKLKAANERLADLEAREAARVERLTARNEDRVKALPDTLAALVPEGLDPDTLSGWLDKAAGAASRDGEARGTRTRGGKPGKRQIPAECVAEAKAHRKDPEYWFDNVWLRTARGKKWAADTNYQPST